MRNAFTPDIKEMHSTLTLVVQMFFYLSHFGGLTCKICKNCFKISKN